MIYKYLHAWRKLTRTDIQNLHNKNRILFWRRNRKLMSVFWTSRLVTNLNDSLTTSSHFPRKISRHFVLNFEPMHQEASRLCPPIQNQRLEPWSQWLLRVKFEQSFMQFLTSLQSVYKFSELVEEVKCAQVSSKKFPEAMKPGVRISIYKTAKW